MADLTTSSPNDEAIALELARHLGTDPETVLRVAMLKTGEDGKAAAARRQGVDPKTLDLVSQLNSKISAFVSPPDDENNLSFGCPHCGQSYAADLKNTACRIYICGFKKTADGRIVQHPQHSEGTAPEDLWVGCGKQFRLVEKDGKKIMERCSGQ